jgi:Brp/Blh family beta-carotene 15,15'-monooxygenase
VSFGLFFQVNETLEFIIAYFFVLTIGVGHGANDIKIYFIDQQLEKIKAIKFIVIYSFAVILGFAAFFLVPDLILVLFLTVSGFHFGQEHFERFDIKKTWLKTIFLTAYGLMILLGLLSINAAQSLPIINDLVINEINESFLAIAFYTSVIITIVLGFTQLRHLKTTDIIKEIMYLIVLYAIFKGCSLIWGFAIYFVLWHSLPSINHQVIHLYGGVTKASLWQYVKSSLLYWIAALIFLAVLYYFLNQKDTLFLTVIVAFLGGITFPHVFVMHKIHK